MSKLRDIQKSLEAMKGDKKAEEEAKTKRIKGTADKIRASIKAPSQGKPKTKRASPKKMSASIDKACREFVLNGEDRTKAYRDSFPQSARWKDSTVWNKASQLFIRQDVIERVEELRAEVAAIAKEKFKVDAAYVLHRLVQIDKMDVIDILEDDGSVKPISKWPEVWRQTLSGLDISETMSGKDGALAILKKIKWPDKIKNLEMMGKHVSVGAFRDQIGLGDPDGNPYAINSITLVGGPGEQ